MISGRTLDLSLIREDNVYTARALGMAGAYTAAGNDYSAVLFNPACLTRLRSKEFHLSMGIRSLENRASNNAGKSGTGKATETKLNSIGFVYPFPTRQGSLVMALGYARSRDFLDALELAGASRSLSARSAGHLSDFDGALAVDLSPNVSAGLGLTWHAGFEDFVQTIPDTVLSIKDDYSGFALKAGLQVRLLQVLQFGASARFMGRIFMTRESSVLSRDTLFVDPDADMSLDYPLELTFGAAYSTVPLTVSLDAGYFNASNTRYAWEDEAPVNFTDELRDSYRAALGADWLVPGTPLKLRGGAGYDESAYLSESRNNPFYYTTGIGVLIDRALAIDAAGFARFTTVTNSDPAVRGLTEKLSIYRLLLTLSYRY